MALRRFVKGGADDLGLLHGAFHIRHLFRALVNEQHDEVDFRAVGVDGIGQRLQQNGLARARRGHDEPALTTSNGGHEVDDAVGKVFLAIFHDELVVGIDGGEVVKKDKIFGVFRGFKADFRDLEQREVAFALLGRADLPRNNVAFAQRKPADL